MFQEQSRFLFWPNKVVRCYRYPSASVQVWVCCLTYTKPLPADSSSVRTHLKESSLQLCQYKRFSTTKIIWRVKINEIFEIIICQTYIKTRKTKRKNSTTPYRPTTVSNMILKMDHHEVRQTISPVHQTLTRTETTCESESIPKQLSTQVHILWNLHLSLCFIIRQWIY